jgi:hypothetical protein
MHAPLPVRVKGSACVLHSYVCVRRCGHPCLALGEPAQRVVALSPHKGAKRVGASLGGFWRQ